MEQQRPPSPCTRICTLDDDGVCLGCQRTIDEIVKWANLSPSEQCAIIAELPRRRQQRAAAT